MNKKSAAPTVGAVGNGGGKMASIPTSYSITSSITEQDDTDARSWLLDHGFNVGDLELIRLLGYTPANLFKSFIYPTLADNVCTEEEVFSTLQQLHPELFSLEGLC